MLLDVLNKPLEATFVVIEEEVEMENWGWGGSPVARISEEARKGVRRLAAIRSWFT